MFNLDGGSADQFGHLLLLKRLFAGDIAEGMAVTQASSANMTVVVNNGSCFIPTGTYPNSYAFDCATTTSGGKAVTVPTANTSNPRIDTIVAYVNTSATLSTSPANNPGVLVFADVPGTPASSPSAPSGATIEAAIGAGNPYITLANVLVGANVTSIVNSNITDLRTWASFSTQNITLPSDFRVYRNNSFNATSSSPVIVWDTNSGANAYDTLGEVSLSTGLFTCTIAGKYDFKARSGLATASGNEVIVTLQKNGSDWAAGDRGISTNTQSGLVASFVSDQIPLAIGDTVGVTIYSNSTIAAQAGPSTTYFSGHLMGSD